MLGEFTLHNIETDDVYDCRHRAVYVGKGTIGAIAAVEDRLRE